MLSEGSCWTLDLGILDFRLLYGAAPGCRHCCERRSRGSSHQVVRRRHVTSGESGHHGVGTGQHAAAAAAGAAQTATRAANLHVFVHEDKDLSKEEIRDACGVLFGVTVGVTAERRTEEKMRCKYVDISGGYRFIK